MTRSDVVRAWGSRMLKLGVVLALGALVIPDAAVHPTTISLTSVERAKQVDFEGGVVWILAVGSDARPGEELTEARGDAIQLVAVDTDSGAAAGIGVPRDAWVDIPGEGFRRINEALNLGGPDLMATVVEDLVGVTPDYVLLTGFTGFRAMIDAVGGVTVRSPVAFRNPEYDLTVRKGRNRFDSREALDFTRTRIGLTGGDFDRSANQQATMLGILRELRAHEDAEGFMERGALSALGALETDLGPTELYRLAQAITQVRPGRVTTCVVAGTPLRTSLGAQVIDPDLVQARALGRDARDARLSPGCAG